jgi:hypothetical protein
MGDDRSLACAYASCTYASLSSERDATAADTACACVVGDVAWRAGLSPPLVRDARWTGLAPPSDRVGSRSLLVGSARSAVALVGRGGTATAHV